MRVGMQVVRFFLLTFLLFSCSARQCYVPEIPCEWHTKPAPGMIISSMDGFLWWKALEDPVLDYLLYQVENCDSIYADIAKSYFELVASQHTLDILKEQIYAYQESLQLTEALLIAGFTNTQDQLHAQELLITQKAQIPTVELSIQKSINHLTTLLGYVPGDLDWLLCQKNCLPNLPCYLPIKSPAEVLDCKCSLEALEEVENGIASYNTALKRHALFAETWGASQKEYREIYDLYQRGFKSYLDVQTSLQAMLNAKNNLLQSKLDLILSYIALYRALEG